MLATLHFPKHPTGPPDSGLVSFGPPGLAWDMAPSGERGSAGDLDQVGQGIGFFRSYADSFWKSTQMELDLVHQEGDAWTTIAGRIKGAECRDLALDEEASLACEQCFRETCERAKRREGFQSSICHAGRRFSVCALGEFDGRKLLLLAGRVRVWADEADGVPTSGNPGNEPAKTPVEYDAAIRLLELSLPYLSSRLKIEALVGDRRLSPLVRKACSFVDQHYNEELRLTHIAKACRVSEDHLSHVFSQQTGHPLTRYIGAVRIGHAMFLLSRTKLDITEICFEVGYQSISQFNRAFRAMKGMSPSQYRKAKIA